MISHFLPEAASFFIPLLVSCVIVVEFLAQNDFLVLSLMHTHILHVTSVSGFLFTHCILTLYSAMMM